VAVGCTTATQTKKLPSNPYIKPPKEERNWLGSWFRPKEPEPPDSVDEFLRLKRP
jgi:hypothetical protein